MSDPPITKDMTVLDVVSTYPGTENVFMAYDDRAGECICCKSLFETIEAVAEKYGLDINELTEDLTKAVHQEDD